MTLCSVISLCVKLENIKWTSSEHQGQGDKETATKKGGKFVPYYCVCVSVSVDGDVLVLELKEFYTRYTNDVIATAAFGIGVDSFKQPTNEFYMMGQDVSYLGGLRAFKWLAYVTMPKLMQVSAVVRTHLHWAQSFRSQHFFSLSRNSLNFTGPEGSSLHSKQPIACIYPEPDPSSPHPPTPVPSHKF